ncbi:MAG TPA: VOC family protein [Anaerolineaceae bacterium]|nr:VOC family protein [Anaerolineaceae bacterium]
MISEIFVNLPVSNLERSLAFYTKLGFTNVPQFTDANAAAMRINEHAFVMLLVKDFFRTFTAREIADTEKTVSVINSLAVSSRIEVDEFMEKALAAGARKNRDPYDYGYMYGRSFLDPDGHLWEVFYMDPAHIQSEN